MVVHHTEQNSGLDLIQLAGRLCLALVFFAAGIAKLPEWASMVAVVQSRGLPEPGLMLGAAAALQIVAGAFLLLGWHTRLAALALAGFTIVATVIFHPFWDTAPDRFELDFAITMSNLAVLGGLLFIAGTGGGRHSLDSGPGEG